ncbi:NAD(P)-dependent oxidoreductase [Actinocorallia sp. API 0066]|uniref:NAD-dependent epimerase/dehydratase family protein n=1 Tax=Actinocorallia sp. API 0066 TaxID=2896846 RepID=UPI001E4BE5ED|nr:NAD(P)-dependent oxidoreductase [Actinocorallia sp. API 0066]MCD0452761.1 NAD(P)-dependent oxidoreductase [Actinocorallia sp. API 0066]
MRVLVAGATGVIGRRLVPLLAGTGHEVFALARTPDPAPPPVRPLAVDALEAADLRAAVLEAKPDAVVNLLTAIPPVIDPRRMERAFAQTNRLRTEATVTLLEAARDAGASRIVCEGLAYAYDPAGEGPADEDAPFWHDPPKQFATTQRALVELEALTHAADGLVLRLGHLYGPGTAYSPLGPDEQSPDGWITGQIRERRVPVVGEGTAVFSFLHADDAAAAVAAALTTGVTGSLNVVDDTPTPVAEWLPALAELLGAEPPHRVPTPLARLVTGAWGVAFFTRLRGADNTRAKAELSWRPKYASWKEGFAADLQAAVRP